MAISDLFDSEFRKRNKSHFASIVRMAMSDDVITKGEQKFLYRLANNLNMSEADYQKILKEYNSYPINVPTSYDDRLERLYDLARMVWADKIRQKDQVKLLRKFCVALGFHAVNAKYITKKALELVKQEDDLEQFIYGIKNMNQ